MSLPDSAKTTGRFLLGMEVLTSELIPNCRRSLVMVGTHTRTKEKGWYASCRKTGKLENFGPYESFSRALRMMALSKGCDQCKFNQAEFKADYLSILDRELEKEIASVFGEDHILSIVTGPLQSFVENRRVIDVLFKSIFGTRFFKSMPDDSVAIKDFMIPCRTEQNFIHKISALAGLVDRIEETSIKKIISTVDVNDVKGSVNILEQILKENKPDYRRYVIKNLRLLMSLRSKFYPTHAHSSDIVKVLQNLGIDKYPLDDWEKGWRKIFSLISASFIGLIKELQDLL